MLKESVIGVEVFGRSPGYDPKTDPIVRVQARRLRAKLDAWYLTGGQASAVRIALPKGGYTPEFGPPPAPEPPSVAAVPQKRRGMQVVAPIAAVLILGAGAAILTIPKSKPAATGSRLFTAFPGYQTSPAFSPDGLTLAFAWGGPDGDNVDIYVQPLDADAPRRLTTSPERERNPVWLPDGKHIGFLRDNGTDRLAVMVVPILGAGERRVAEIRGSLATPPTLAWAHDGKRIYTSEPVSPGKPLQIVEISLESGGRRVLFPSATHGPAAGALGDD